jgi:glucosamine--fructose-6-phosphate aminotransferase (isomerizing)
MRMARERGATVLALTNVPGSQATRDADGILFTQAGSETSVAATKTFVAQVAGFSLLALKLAQVRGTLPEGQIAALTNDLARMPDLIDQTISRTEEWAKRTAAELAEQDFFMFLGRHVGVPVAQEAALKLKEITYIPADAYAAGEMKHGPIALLSEGTPVICVATESPVLDKLHSNMAEVRARGARVIAVATDGDTQTASFSDDVVTVPESDWLLQPLLAIVPLQLLAYYIAGERGLNVDQPRNLAKTVTVE